MPIQGPSATLFYRDADAAIRFLEEAFGFRTVLRVPGEDGSVRHSELDCGGGFYVMVSTARPEQGWLSPLDSGGLTAILYTAVEDADAHHARAVAAGARISREPTDTDYGSRDYGAFDPEGHHWSFGTYALGTTPAG